jgi:deoxyribose-phosphate aldolase
VKSSEMARCIDHTLLKPEATQVAVSALCDEANEFGVVAVCVSPSMLPLHAGMLNDTTGVCTVVGFPSGAVDSRIKAAEASLAFSAGAKEIDMVANLGFIKLADWEALEAEIMAVAAAVPFALLKVILETGALSEKEIVEACRVAASAGADFVKTSTGFHPAGGATVEVVALMAETIGDELGIKASGGIRTTETALAMINAGATRIGTSSTAAILGGLK